MSNSMQTLPHRLAERGRQRVDLCVSVSDADLIRRVANALTNDDETARHLRDALQDEVPGKVPIKFKDWLASFPNEEAH